MTEHAAHVTMTFDPEAPAERRHHHEPLSERATHPVAISVEGVSKVFETSERTRTAALDDVSFAIRVGEFVSLIGPSGCGKSTILRLVSGLLEPSGGHITVQGVAPVEARRKRQFGIVFQSPVLFDWRTVESNVALPLEVMHEPKAKAAERVDELLELVGLTTFRRHYPWQLSGGMQQRVAIARALTYAPPFLLMDEPFGALDMITRDRMANELLRIWANTAGTTVLFITHSIPEAVLLSDRVVVMSTRPGRVMTTVDIELPRPRTEAVRESQAFFRYENELRGLLIAAEGSRA
ncbi:MAG: ABC transporter ATP-binding protein [Candidatus Limnocylindrales bacterium]